MNRRTFLTAVAAVGGSLMIRRFASAQVLEAATQPSSAASQAAAIRAAAARFLQTLTPALQKRVTFAFPKGATPAPVAFGEMGNTPRGMMGGQGGPGGPGAQGGQGKPHRDVSFDTDGNLLAGSDGGPQGRGGPGFGPRDRGPNGGRPAAGEKFGQAVWTNFPVDNVKRPGLQMGELSAPQRDAAHSLLKTVLSPMGYQKVLDIMTADQIVADNGPDYAAGLDVYTIGLFGEPSATSPWMLQFGGHHLGLNVVFAGDKAVIAPLHTGILPARFDAKGRIVRGLGRENDKAFDLLATFSPAQLKSAIIEHKVDDLLCGPGRPTVTFAQQGLRGSDMSDAQRAAMLSLASEWVGILNDAQSAGRLEEIRKGLADTFFAWSGPTTHEPGHNGEAYFRIHGPTVMIEHAPQGNQGGYKVHVHTIMRDLTNDYGKAMV